MSALVRRCGCILDLGCAHDETPSLAQSVAAHLADQPSDNAVQGAVQAALDRTPVFMCDAKPKEKTP
jgi:hypothetical protein